MYVHNYIVHLILLFFVFLFQQTVMASSVDDIKSLDDIKECPKCTYMCKYFE